MHRKGCHGTGIQAIVNAAGVPKGSFFNYFKSKEEFVLAAMEYTSRSQIAGFEAALLDGATSPRQRILDIYTSMTKAYGDARSYSTGCLVGNLCQELADTRTAVAEKAEYLFRIYTAALTRCIRNAQDAGEVKRDADPDGLAEAIFNSWEGAVLRMKSRRSIHPLKAFLAILAALLR